MKNASVAHDTSILVKNHNFKIKSVKQNIGNEHLFFAIPKSSVTKKQIVI